MRNVFFLSRSIQDQQLVLEKQGFGPARAPLGSHGPDRRGDEMNDQGEPIAHAANNVWSWPRSQVCTSVADRGRIASRHGQAMMSKSS